MAWRTCRGVSLVLLDCGQWPIIRRAEAWTALAGDEAWVIGTLMLVLGFPTALNASGNAVAVLVALVVAVFAVPGVRWDPADGVTPGGPRPTRGPG